MNTYVPALRDIPHHTRLTLALILSLLVFPFGTLANDLPINTDTPLALSIKESSGLQLTQKWMNKKSQPITDGTGRVTYFFGDTLPSVVCSPLKTCVVELQAGEIITQGGLQVGDSVRWRVSPTISGSGPEKRTNLIIKPTDTALETTLTIATNKRIYQIKLLSRANDWMPFVNFDYPELLQFEWEQYSQAMEAERVNNSLPTGQYVPELDFNYLVKGKTAFKPLRVYNDGLKTVIEMPNKVEQMSLPTLLVVNGSQRELVNYRYKNSYTLDGRKINGRFIVDQISKELILVSGVGSDAKTVLIKYQG
ncbi:P-type conjugative transfer protein TrbG [Shewanella colwelliana]|uniref:P-type conjugative transfer protein TrbG n=1 Tax=Shewanella colwelliana TaxID=23 RepID=UPI003734CA4F